MESYRAPASLNELLARQHRVASRAQLLEVGVTADMIRWWVRRGAWQRVLPGVYAAFSGAPDPDQRLVAATLHAGQGAQITGAAALRWHGLRYLPATERVHVLVPHTTRRSSTGFVVLQRTARLDERSRLRTSIEVCSATRAVADAARTATELSEVRAYLAEAVQRRRTTVAELFAELDAGPVRGSALLRTALGEVSAGARSAPEAEFRAVLRDSTLLPEIIWNPRLRTADGERLPTPDGWIAEVGIALEVDSREYHLTPEGWSTTMRRHNRLAELGVLVLHFSPAQIRREPATVLATVEHAYRERARTIAGFTAVRALPAP